MNFAEKDGPMIRSVLLAAALALSFPLIGSAQQNVPPTEQPGAEVVGLPVYSSDGEKLGEVIQVGTVGGQRAVRAEIGAFLGEGPTPVVIPAEIPQHKADRVEVAMTAAEIRTSMGRQKR